MKACGGGLTLALAVAALFGFSPAAAQRWVSTDTLPLYRPGPPRLDLWAGVGTSVSSDWSEQVVLETRHASGARTIRLLLPEMAMAPGPTYGAGVTYWRVPLGVRFQAGFTRACVTAGATRCDAAPDPETPTAFETDVDVWTYGVQGVIGLTDGALGRVVRPYVLLGAAGMTFDPAEAVPGGGIPEGTTVPPTGGGDVIVVDGTSDLILTLDRLGFETRLALEVGAGVDLRLPLGPHGIGVRLDFVDQMITSPVGITITRLDGGLVGSSGIEARVERPLVHTLRATVGVVLDIGLPTPEPEPEWVAEP